MAGADDDYVCKLDASSIEKAKKELNEDAKDRLGAVDALRTWIQQQPHITFNADTSTLLYFLRTAKFSQLRARTIIENYVKIATSHPHWFLNVDTHDPDTWEPIDRGYLVPLPKKDKNGCIILLYKLGATRKNGELFTVPHEIRAGTIVANFAHVDENIQVNGYAFVLDMTGIGPKHLAHWSSDDMRKWGSCWESAMPGRYKEFHYYNAGAIFDALMALFKPFLSKKMQERIHVHDTMESLYKAVGMDLLPDEYLPDDYTGPSAGSMQEIVEKFKCEAMEEKFRQDVLRRSNPQNIYLDESKRPTYKPVQESFRKLAVD